MNQFTRRVNAFTSVVFAAVLAAPAWSAAPGGRQVGIDRNAFSTYLVWLSQSNTTYAIQDKTNLRQSAWSDLTDVSATGPEATWPIPLPDSPSRFFRVLFPQPTILAGEPAFGPLAGGITVYITGTHFYAGDLILVGGLPLSSVTFLSPTLLSGVLPALPDPGLYDIAVISGASGAVLAILPEAFEVAPPLERRLQETPEWPPAGPSPARKDFKGHVTLMKAFDDEDAASSARYTKTGHVTLMKAFDDEEAASSARYTKTGHVTLMKAFDDEGAASSARYTKTGHVTLMKAFDDTTPDLRLHSGEVQQQVVDLSVPGQGLDFVWARTYRSRTGTATAQGTRWSHSYDVRCVQGTNAFDVYDGTGRKDTFRIQANGTYTCPGFFREGTLSNGVFRLTFADTGYWEFTPLGGSPAAGKLARIQDRNGNAVTCAYGDTGRLAQVIDALDRTFTLTYTPEGRVATVSDFTGRTVTYAYYGQGEAGGNAGDLKSVTSPPVTGTPNGNDFPLGKTVTYTYTTGFADPRQNSLMLSIVDALGQTASQCAYELDPGAAAFLRCASVRRGTLPPACITYVQETPSPDNRFAAVRCTVNDPVGNVSELSYDIRNRCVTLREFTGRAAAGVPVSDQENRPYGRLRLTDPDFFETRYSWNNESLCIGAALPGGNVLSRVYEADLNPAAPPRKRGDLRTFHQDPGSLAAADSDGDGIPDLAEITRRYTYDPRFGSEPSWQSWDGAAKGNKGINETLPYATLHAGREASSKGKRLGIGDTSPESPLGSVSAKIITDRDSGRSKGFAFVTTSTDPLGTETAGEYDAHGNLTRATVQVIPVNYSPVVDLAYDAHGQLTTVTRAADATGRRKIDAFAWSQGMVTQAVEDAASDGLGLTTALGRDARGNVTRVADPLGFETLYTYNALNQAVTVRKQTQQGSFGERVKTSFTYDANDNLVRLDQENRAPDGTLDPVNPEWTTTLGYDGLNRRTLLAHELTHTVQQRVMTNQFDYDANNNLVLHRLPEAVSGADPHNEIAYAYDERDLPFLEASAPGTGLSAVDAYDYDANGNCRRISKVDAITIRQTVMEYDGFDRCVRITDALSNTLTRAFNANDRLVFERVDGETLDIPGGELNRRLAETRYAYDALNRLNGRRCSFFDVFTELSIGDGNATNAWAYAPNGQLLSATDDNGHTTRYGYDSAGRLATVTDPKDNVTQYACDACGRIAAIRATDRSDVSAGEQLFTRTYTYDGLGRCLSASNNVGNAVRYAYDSCGNCVSQTDAASNETVRVFDGLGRVTDTTDYVGAKERGITINTSHVEYRNNRCVSTTDGNSNTTAYAYDACDRQTETTRPDSTVESLVWSPRSNLELRIDPNGTATTNSYDLLDRIVHRDIAAGAGVAATTTFETFAYDGLGRLVAATNDGSSLNFAYDSLGHCVRADEGGSVTRYSYDGEGNRLSLTYPSGPGAYSTYDALNRIATLGVRPSVDGELAGLATFAYDGPDRLAKITRANGINTRVFWNGAQNPANAAGDFGWQQVSRVNHARAGGGQVVDQRVSAYSRNQDKTLRAMTAPWSSGGPVTTNAYGYDRLHRLTRGTRSGGSPGDYEKTYVLDANGNRLQVTNNGLAEVYTMDATLPEPADRQMDQYTETPFGSETHDANGNRIASVSPTNSTFYRYDYADRLVQVDLLVGKSLPTPVATYSYDPLGRRIGKAVFHAGLPPETTRFVYGDDCDDTDDSAIETYRSGAVSSVSVLAGKGGGAAAASYAATGRMLRPPLVIFGAAGEAYFTHCDELGNVLALTDAAGSVVEHYDYDDFGLPAFFDGSGTPLPASDIGLPVLFRGLFWDGETGLYCRSGVNPLYEEGGLSGHNPFYDPKTGRSAGSGTKSPLYDDAGLTGKKGLNAVNVKQARTTDVTGEIDLPQGRVTVRGWDPEKKEAISGRMKNGTVKFFNEAKGFGFVTGSGPGDPALRSIQDARKSILSIIR